MLRRHLPFSSVSKWIHYHENGFRHAYPSIQSVTVQNILEFSHHNTVMRWFSKLCIQDIFQVGCNSFKQSHWWRQHGLHYDWCTDSTRVPFAYFQDGIQGHGRNNYIGTKRGTPCSSRVCDKHPGISAGMFPQLVSTLASLQVYSNSPGFMAGTVLRH